MSGKPKKRRIAVALDASEHSRRALQIAASIAAALEAEIEGVFVENADLFRLAGLPFLRELRHASVGEDALDADRLQREMRALARQTRQALEQSARQFGVTWTFRVWRGNIEAEILNAAVEAEMFALGRMGNFAPFRPRVKAQQPPAHADRFAIGILYNGSDASTRALADAAELAGRQQAPLTVLLQGANPDTIDKLREKAAVLLGQMGEKVRFLPLETSNSETLAKAILRSGSDLLIVDAHNPLFDHRMLWQCLQALHCPVLVVR
jgi:nucleotide-binding universal stress UspA family protein